jgi:ABC-type uncharacterized transport system involved in gliding motility auxiliary subunit
MKNRKLFSLGALLVAILLFIGINLAAGPLFRTSRIDLTQNHLYTLSQGTRHILKNLKIPITLSLYWSKGTAKNFPGVQSYEERVKEMLDEYAVVAGPKLILKTVDPEPFSAAEDNAVRYGLKGVSVGNQESLYFGLVAQAKDGGRQVIPFFQQRREKFLEYDLTQAIYNLAHPKKPTVGLLSAISMDGGPSPGNPYARSRPWMIMKQLRERFDVRPLGRDIASIPKGIDVLMVVQPQQLSKKVLYAVDQYVLKGGHALVFTDPMSESLPGHGMYSKDPEAAKLLESWGVELTPDKVVGDLGAALQVAVGNASRSRVVVYPPWVSLGQDQMNHKEIVTSQLQRLNLATAGALETLPKVGTKVIPLVHSTSQAMLIPSKKVASTESDPGQLLEGFKAGGHPFTLAVRISGTAKTAFPQGPPAPAAGKKGEKGKKATKKEKSAPQVKVSKEPINVIVVADTDMLEDRFWVQVQNFFGQRIAVPMAANADFVVNALDQLSGSPDLISVRSRGSYERPFTLVDRIQKQAEQQYQAKEQGLMAELKTTEKKLNELQRQRGKAGSTTLTAAQHKEVQKFRLEVVQTRKKLRAVQYNLRKNIETLENALKALNIFLIPLLIGFIAFLVWLLRRDRDRGYPK